MALLETFVVVVDSVDSVVVVNVLAVALLVVKLRLGALIPWSVGLSFLQKLQKKLQTFKKLQKIKVYVLISLHQNGKQLQE